MTREFGKAGMPVTRQRRMTSDAGNRGSVAKGVSEKCVWEMTDDEEYCEYVRMRPTAEEAIKLALCESRFITTWHPPYSNQASDMIGNWMEELKTEWENG
jgi:hypothetical protein